MKNAMRKLIEKLLALRAHKVVRNAQTIIGVTGSVGKTSTRMAIADVLSNNFIVQKSRENFNTPIGMLLTLLGISEAGKTAFGWLQILIKAYFRALPCPQILVLEYGVDTPGDMAALLAIATPDIAIITPVARAHTAHGQFADVEEIRNEKLKLAIAAQEVILNSVDPETVAAFLKLKRPSQMVTIFGVDDACDEKFTFHRMTINGITFAFDGDEFFVPMFGSFQVQVFAPAILLGKKFNITIKDMQQTLAGLQPPPGRGRILQGKNGSCLWDFSYNSSPLATGQILKSLAEIDWPNRKIALLGTMNELGDAASQEHENLGKAAAKYADELVYVGEYAEDFLRGAGDQTKIQTFKTAPEAGLYLADKLQEGDFVLIKGSQNGVFLESAIEYLLADKNDVVHLCRWSKSWYDKRNKWFSAQN